MSPTHDPRTVRRRALWAFLRGRLLAARIELFIAVGLALGATALSPEPHRVLPPALLLIALIAVWSISGRAVARSMLPGLLLGLLPLGCSLFAGRFGHVCHAGGCSSLCVPLCTAGGALSGLLLARAARKTGEPLVLWTAGGAVVLAAGAMGCMCVGAAGLVGMVLGFLPSAALLALPRRA